MKERPILFSSPMVRANRAGRKTQTRRIVSPKHVGIMGGKRGDTDNCLDLCLYGVLGDRLWVRETWASAYSCGCWGTLFAADKTFAQGARRHEKGPHFNADDLPPVTWRPSIFMPRWACRNVYEITDVRVQQLQDISEEDAEAEGVATLDGSIDEQALYAMAKAIGGTATDSRVWYAVLWDSINAKRASWDSNPWVWAVSYRPVSK